MGLGWKGVGSIPGLSLVEVHMSLSLALEIFLASEVRLWQSWLSHALRRNGRSSEDFLQMPLLGAHPLQFCSNRLALTQTLVGSAVLHLAMLACT